MGKDSMGRYRYYNKRGRLVYGHLQSIETQAPFILMYRNQQSKLWDFISYSTDYHYLEDEKTIAIGKHGHSEVEIWATLKEHFGDGIYG